MGLSVLLSLAFGDSLSQPVPLFYYLAGMIPQAVIMNWIYFHTNRSVLSAVVFHFLINFVGEAFHISQLSKSIVRAYEARGSFGTPSLLSVPFDTADSGGSTRRRRISALSQLCRKKVGDRSHTFCPIRPDMPREVVTDL